MLHKTGSVQIEAAHEGLQQPSKTAYQPVCYQQNTTHQAVKPAYLLSKLIKSNVPIQADAQSQFTIYRTDHPKEATGATAHHTIEHIQINVESLPQKARLLH